MWRNVLILSSCLCFCTHVAAYPSHSGDILRNACVERSQREFARMRKEQKVTVNGRQLGYYGFENSASAVILLDVSRTSVQIPRLNMSFTNLIKLQASRNGLTCIDDIGSDTFPSLKFLNLSHNAIATLHSSVFRHLSELEVLDLSHNCLTHFSYDHVLLRHENVKKLYLRDNLLHTVRGATGVNHVLQLEVMDLAENFIEEFSDFSIEIGELRLERNLLKSLLIRHANGMRLNASRNSITSLSAEGSFEILDLSHNHIRFLSHVEIKNARVLRVAHNRIEDWSPIDASDDYSENSSETIHSISVETLDISYNNITSVNALRHFEGLVSVDMESNQLSGVDIESVRVKFPSLKYLNFIGNPLTEVDRDEMKFHNNTRFLNLHIDYEASTPRPLLSSLLLPTLAASTTTVASFVESASEITDTGNVGGGGGEVIIERRPQFWLLMAGALVISVFMASIIYYRRRSTRQMRAMKREFNEAENFQF